MGMLTSKYSALAKGLRSSGRGMSCISADTCSAYHVANMVIPPFLNIYPAAVTTLLISESHGDPAGSNRATIRSSPKPGRCQQTPPSQESLEKLTCDISCVHNDSAMLVTTTPSPFPAPFESYATTQEFRFVQNPHDHERHEGPAAFEPSS